MSESAIAAMGVLTTIGIYLIIGLILYIAIKSLIRYGINYYFDVIDDRAKEFAEVKERIRRAGLNADIKRINEQLDEMERQRKN